MQSGIEGRKKEEEIYTEQMVVEREGERKIQHGSEGGEDREGDGR